MSTTSAKIPILRVMSIRDFRLLFAGSATSLLGDQFALIAVPWLVLKLTGDPLILGINLALEGRVKPNRSYPAFRWLAVH